MAEFKTLLLDVDDTLLDFKATEKEAFAHTFEKHGYPLNEEIKKIYDTINHTLWGQYEKGLISRDAVIYSRFVKLFQEVGIAGDGIRFEDEYQELLGEGHHLIEGAMELLAYLEKKYDLYIVTNGVTRTQQKRLHDSGIEEYVKQIFVSEMTGFQKPMTEFFDYCFERIPNLDLSKTMIIGDSLSSDIKGGNNAGIATCWYNPKNLSGDRQVKADYEIKDLQELYGIL